MESHRAKQLELIEQLKQQLEDLERYAYETGEAGLPQTQVVERQRIIIGNWFCCMYSQPFSILSHFLLTQTR